MEDTSDLPPYSHNADVDHPPPTQSSRELVTRSVSLKDSHGKEYATLNIVSSARSADHMPIMREGEPLEGSLELNLVEDTSMQSVSISVSVEFDCPSQKLRVYISHNMHDRL